MANSIVLLCVCGIAAALATNVRRPHGVPLSKAALYNPDVEFKCFDGSKAVNDDYCDCADGSDEPGTAACPDTTFHCVNQGHRSEAIPSSRVNDGICDCCDGSDEWAGYAMCPNMCDELGRAAREHAEKHALMIKQGWELRKTLVDDAKKLRAEHTTKLAELQTEKTAMEPDKKEMDENKREVEERETLAKNVFREGWESGRDAAKRVAAEEAFALLDINADGHLDGEDLVARLEFDDDLDNVVGEQETKDALGGETRVDKEAFVTSVWDNFRLTYKSPEQLEEDAAEAPVVDKEIIDENFDTEDDATGEKKQHWDARGELVDDDEDEEDDIGDEDEEPANDVKYKRENANREKYTTEEAMPAYPADVQAVIDQADGVRKLSREFDDRVDTVERDIKSVEEFLAEKFGADSVWAALKSTCVELTDSSYIYKLCLFDKASQRPIHGGSETSLGTWGEWTEEGGQMYSHGQGCWNGPDRSCRVLVECGLETTLLAASEPGRCEYEFKMATPAACPDPMSLDTEHVQHAEL